MKALSKIYNDILKNTQWKYHHNPVDYSVFRKKEGSRAFIKSYLGEAGKTRTRIFKYLEDITLDRTKHILSCFLLGIFFYEENNHVKNSINKFLKKLPSKKNESEKERFLYLWMLVCLFHDFGYAVEEDTKSITKKDLFKYIKQMPIKNKGVPQLYNKKLLKNYDAYKLCRFNCHDHGIVGGAVLYNDLCQLREEKKNLNLDNLYWEKDLENDFGVAAWIIACHNIFFIEENDSYASCYKRFELEKLIYSNRARMINLERYPVFYLLCLVDSIEPLKTCSDASILSKISIGISSTHLELNTKAMQCQCKKKMYHKKTSALKEWLTDVEESEDVLKIFMGDL